ncbi:MAG TPA: hypothetical protein VNI57_05245, partial [Candidatus Saccharimonadales bacterium]|nr:hypothetical protein [Candidatus Saccharimonadales bacterium]
VSPGHLDESACADRGPAALMLPKAVPGRAVHRPGRAVLGVLEDLGWRLRPADPPVLAAGPVIYY